MLLLITLAGGCKSSRPASTDAWKKTVYKSTWTLVELNGEQVHKTERVNPYLEFSKDDRVSGSIGCNQLAGSCKFLDDGKIRISPVVTTKMACPDGDLEFRFIKLLSTVDGWAIKNETLYLKIGSNVAAVFRSSDQ